VTVFDKSARSDGTFSRDDFTYDHERDIYVCPGGRTLTTTGTRVNDGATVLYRASRRDCAACPLKLRCCPKESARKIPRSIHEGARDIAYRRADQLQVPSAARGTGAATGRTLSDPLAALSCGEKSRCFGSARMPRCRSRGLALKLSIRAEATCLTGRRPGERLPSLIARDPSGSDLNYFEK
jgi:hypothetical protein